MMSSRSRREVGQHDGLPDFVDPTELDGASWEASSVWGQESHPRSEQVRPPSRRRQRGVESPDPGVPQSDSAVEVGVSGHGVGTPGNGSRRDGASRSRASTARGQTTKRLSWAQKQERREKRAAKRQEEEAAQRAKDPLGFAREIVLTQLTAAPRSRAQLVEKLRAKEVDDDVIEAVLDRMEDVGLVDDSAYAGMLVRSRVASRGLARRALAQELQRKGIEAEVATQALEEIDDESERARALELARKKFATMSRLDEQARARRLAGLLARKGYPPATVWSVVKELQGSFETDEAL